MTNRDTSHLEAIAEDRISHELQKNDFLVAKPKFDLVGTDLLAFVRMADGVKFARVQSKGRRIDDTTSVSIPASYVTEGFVVFLYLQDSSKNEWLYCFFAPDIRQWIRSANDDYSISIPRDSHETKFAFARVTTARLQALRFHIQQADIQGEFKHLSLLTGNAQLGDAVATGVIRGADVGGA